MGLVFTPKEAAALGIKIPEEDKKRKNKYNAKKIEVDVQSFEELKQTILDFIQQVKQ